MDNLIGKKLDGRYQLEELIGSGGMANVYKATDLLENRLVAVKILREECRGNEDLVRRFKNESKAISVLDHPIRWTRQDVQVVILMAVAEDEQRDLTNFLQLISEFIANESAVLQLVEEPDFTTFVNLLSQIEM